MGGLSIKHGAVIIVETWIVLLDATMSLLTVQALTSGDALDIIQILMEGCIARFTVMQLIPC